MDPIAWQLLIAELVLVLLLALLSASEAAIHAIRRPHLIEELAGRGGRGRRAGALGERSVHYLASIQVGEFLVVFAFSGIAAAFISPRLSQLLALFPLGSTPVIGDTAAVAITVAALSLVAVWFGIFVPRAVGARYPQPTLLALVWPIEIVTLVLAPFVGLLFALTKVVTAPFGAAPAPGALVSEEEIQALVETGEEQGVVGEAERDMIRSVFELGDKHVHEVMVPRTDIVAIDVTTPPEEVFDIIVRQGHSRIPVYESSADAIIGVLYVRDLFKHLAHGDRGLAIKSLLRPAQFVPETKKIDELLREMQQQKVHIAIVVDEYGGTAGLVTIEDLVEEIVGEIRDEYDVEQELVLAVSDHEAVMDGRVPFDDVRESFGLELEATEDYATLGGFIVHQLGRFPNAGEVVELQGVRFVVERLEGRRIRRVRVMRDVPAEEPV